MSKINLSQLVQEELLNVLSEIKLDEAWPTWLGGSKKELSPGERAAQSVSATLGKGIAAREPVAPTAKQTKLADLGARKEKLLARKAELVKKLPKGSVVGDPRKGTITKIPGSAGTGSPEAMAVAKMPKRVAGMSAARLKDKGYEWDPKVGTMMRGGKSVQQNVAAYKARKAGKAATPAAPATLKTPAAAAAPPVPKVAPTPTLAPTDAEKAASMSLPAPQMSMAPGAKRDDRKLRSLPEAIDHMIQEELFNVLSEL